MLGGYYSIVLMRLPDLALEAAFLMGAVAGGLAAPFCASLPGPLGLLSIVLISFLSGTFVGFVTSLLREKLAISHLFASIISIGFFSGIARALLGTTHFSLLSKASPFAIFRVASISPELCTLIVLGGIMCAMHYGILHTQFGLAIEIYGINKLFFTYHHLDARFVGYAGTMLAHGLAGISGYCIAQSQSFVDLMMGAGLGLQVITALLFGIICSERLGLPRMYQPLAGICCYFALHAIILLSGFDLTYFNSAQALMVAASCLYRKQYFAANPTALRTDLGV